LIDSCIFGMCSWESVDYYVQCIVLLCYRHILVSFVYFCRVWKEWYTHFEDAILEIWQIRLKESRLLSVRYHRIAPCTSRNILTCGATRRPTSTCFFFPRPTANGVTKMKSVVVDLLIIVQTDKCRKKFELVWGVFVALWYWYLFCNKDHLAFRLSRIFFLECCAEHPTAEGADAATEENCVGVRVITTGVSHQGPRKVGSREDDFPFSGSSREKLRHTPPKTQATVISTLSVIMDLKTVSR